MQRDSSPRPLGTSIKKLVFASGGLSALLFLAACGSSATKSNPQSLLQSAKNALDSTSGVHFTLQSSNVASGSTVIKGGAGDVIRPDQLQGSLDVVVNGVQVTVKVVAVGNTVEAQLPFTSGYRKIDPATFGLGNPSSLLDPQKGLSSMLTAGSNAKVTGTERISGELLDEVSTDVPGSSIPLLPNANPSQPVVLVAAIDPSSHQLRQVTLTGRFTKATSNATFIVTLTNYGEHVQITLPPVS